jgi:hypothetical protein
MDRFTKTEGGVTSVDVVALEKEMAKNPTRVIEEMKAKLREDFNKKFPEAKPLGK